MDSKINSADVTVTLNGDELILKPSLRAMTNINRQFGGLANARAALVAENHDSVVTILRQGLNLSDRDAKDLPDRVYENGLTGELLVGLIRFVAILGNGGKPLPDQPGDGAEGDDQAPEGNR